MGHGALRAAGQQGRRGVLPRLRGQPPAPARRQPRRPQRAGGAPRAGRGGGRLRREPAPRCRLRPHPQARPDHRPPSGALHRRRLRRRRGRRRRPADQHPGVAGLALGHRLAPSGRLASRSRRGASAGADERGGAGVWRGPSDRPLDPHRRRRARRDPSRRCRAGRGRRAAPALAARGAVGADHCLARLVDGDHPGRSRHGDDGQRGFRRHHRRAGGPGAGAGGARCGGRRGTRRHAGRPRSGGRPAAGARPDRVGAGRRRRVRPRHGAPRDVPARPRRRRCGRLRRAGAACGRRAGAGGPRRPPGRAAAASTRCATTSRSPTFR